MVPYGIDLRHSKRAIHALWLAVERQIRWAASMRGTCLYGGVTFGAVGAPAFVNNCHCSMCRRMHGAAYVTWIELPSEQLRVVEGADALCEFASSEHGRRSFCTSCGSALFCRIDARPDHVDVVMANLEGQLDFAPQLHIFWDDRADWTVVGDELPRLGGKTGMERVDG